VFHHQSKRIGNGFRFWSQSGFAGTAIVDVDHLSIETPQLFQVFCGSLSRFRQYRPEMECAPVKRAPYFSRLVSTMFHLWGFWISSSWPCAVIDIIRFRLFNASSLTEGLARFPVIASMPAHRPARRMRGSLFQRVPTGT
jgi:hypothetical protein